MEDIIDNGTIYSTIPIESIVKERITEIINSEADEIEIAINLRMYCMKT